MGIITPFRDYIDTLVHPTVRQDVLTSSRHRAFIAPRLLGCLMALAVFPIYVAIRGVPSTVEAMVFGWFLLPILIAYFLSRTGRYESAHILHALALAGLITTVALQTGGIASFAAIWLVVVPLEAALSASRRVVASAAIIALGAAGLLLVLSFDDSQSVAHGGAALAALGIVSASLYAAGLALGAESLARTSFSLLYAEEDRYRLLARNMTDVITRHGKNGAVLFVSPAAELLFGATVKDLYGSGLFDRVHVADRPAYLTALADSAAHGVSRSVEFRVRHGTLALPEGGQFIWIEMRCGALASPEAGAVGDREVVAVMRDITHRKEQEEGLGKARAEAERANAAKSRFLATMSHELRTPLNAIIGFSEMLRQEGTLTIDAPRRREYAQLIYDSGHHLLSVVNGILDMSKIEAGNFEIKLEPFSARRAIEDCCGLLAIKGIESNVELVTQLPNDLPSIVADKRSLNQIMLNLVSNAIKFTDQGGKVTVSAKHENDAIIVMVEDTGVGIDADDLARVGDPFFQARSSYDRRHDGTGLGLSIVKGLLALHGGAIAIESRIGEGTRVSFRLPINCENARKVPDIASIRRADASATAQLSDKDDRVKISA